MSAPRLTTLAIKGLVTTPNEYGVYPEGSCSQITNLCARAANQWVAARELNLVSTYATTGSALIKLIGVAPGAFVAFRVFTTGTPNTVWEVLLDGINGQNFVKPGSMSNDQFDYRWLAPFVTRNRLFANGKLGVIVVDTPTVSGSKLRAAGLPQLSYDSRGSGSGTVLPNSTTFTYAALVRRKSSDGYAVTSPPSVAIRYSGGGAPYFLYRWQDFDDFAVGDVVELYRSAGISGADTATDTGTSMRLVASHELTATDISNFYVRIDDRQPTAGPLFETSGVEIYTSPYLDGSTGANLQPPACKAAAQWGTYTFYGNITDDPIWTFDVPAGIVADFADAAALDPWVRANAVGSRNFTGTRAIGSPTITAVSAAEIVGIKPGQQFIGTGFAGTPTVLSVGASSVTLNTNSSTAGTSEYRVDDILEINGQVYTFYSYLELIRTVGSNLGREFAFYPSETVPVTAQHHATGVTLVMRPKRSGIVPTITLRGTNGANYSPVIPEYNQTVKTIGRTERPNFVRWSRSNQPEHVPSPNEMIVGGGQVIALLPTTDCLWALCTDGAYRISGTSGVWRADLVDRSFVPVSPHSCCVLNDVVYAYTPRGFASLSGVQTSLLTKGVLDAQFPPVGFSAEARIHLFANTATEEIVVVFEGATLGSTATTYVFSTLYQQWSVYEPAERRIIALAMFQPTNPAQAPYPIIGTYNPALGSGQAYVRSWRTDTGTPIDPSFRLQPYYGGDPFTQKHWIDATWLISQHPAASANQYIDNAPYGAGAFKADKNDSRVNLGISRAAAIAPTLTIGANLVHGNATPIVLKGVSLRLLGLTTQQRSR